MTSSWTVKFWHCHCRLNFCAVEKTHCSSMPNLTPEGTSKPQYKERLREQRNDLNQKCKQFPTAPKFQTTGTVHSKKGSNSQETKRGPGRPAKKKASEAPKNSEELNCTTNSDFSPLHSTSQSYDLPTANLQQHLALESVPASPDPLADPTMSNFF